MQKRSVKKLLVILELLTIIASNNKYVYPTRPIMHRLQHFLFKLPSQPTKSKLRWRASPRMNVTQYEYERIIDVIDATECNIIYSGLYYQICTGM